MRDILFTFFNYFVFFYTSMLAIFFVMFAFLSFISLKRRKDYYVESYVRKTIKESPYTPGISVIHYRQCKFHACTGVSAI
mgnify:CR=1 FL=1